MNKLTIQELDILELLIKRKLGVFLKKIERDNDGIKIFLTYDSEHNRSEFGYILSVIMKLEKEFNKNIHISVNFDEKYIMLDN